MTKTMKKIFLLFIALLALFPTSKAQESIERLDSEYAKISMIRRYDVRFWLIYSRCIDLYCDFNLVNEYDNTVGILRLPEDFISVSDYKIDKDVVYFCGMMSDNVPCLGYFDMNNFPNSTIHYVRFPTLKKLKKLESMADDTTAHVIMTGAAEEYNVIVDAIPAAGGWNICFIRPYVPNINNDNLYDDIAILDNYVVVTSRPNLIVGDNTNQYNAARLWYFSKPPSSSVPLTASTLEYMEIPYIYTSALGIRKCVNNVFNIAGEVGMGTPYISEFNAFTYNGTVILDTMNAKIKSFCYNPDSKTTDIVLDYPDAAINGSKIYTLLPGLLSYPGTAYGHHFPYHRVNSLAYQSDNILHYIGVGDRIGNTDDLFIYKYFIFQPYECSNVVHVFTRPEKPKVLRELASFNKTPDFYMKHTKYPINKETGTKIICESDNKQ